MQSMDIFEILALQEGENTDNEGDGDGEEVEEADGAYYQDRHVGSDEPPSKNDRKGGNSVDEDDRSIVSGPGEEKIGSGDNSDAEGA